MVLVDNWDPDQLTAFLLWLGFLLAQNLLFFWPSYALTFLHVGFGLGSLSDGCFTETF